MSVRLVVAVVILGLLAGGLWWTAMRGASDRGEALATGSFPVFVVGQDGALLANGTVTARGTPFDTLLALADQDGFEVDVEQQTWIGRGCTATYVVGIAGKRESTTGGWNYYTRQAGGGDWTWRSAGAACHRLGTGDQVEWCWVESDICHHHVP